VSESTQRLSRRGKGFLAVCGTVLFSGLGHWIAGANRRAAAFAVGTVALGMVTFALFWVPQAINFVMLLALFYLLLRIYIIVDAYRVGRRSARNMFTKPVYRYAAGLLLIGASQLFYHFGKPYVVNNPWVHAYSLTATSHSMLPTLRPKDCLVAIEGRLPRRWQVVVFSLPTDGANAVLRVVGLPGETVEITHAGLMIDGVMTLLPLNVGPYIGWPGDPSIPPPHTGCEGNPIHLGLNEYYLLGDNSPMCFDSRYWNIPVPGHQLGAIPADHIGGIVTTIYWPPSRIAALPVPP
jgi:signal peptidase I